MEKHQYNQGDMLYDMYPYEGMPKYLMITGVSEIVEPSGRRHKRYEFQWFTRQGPRSTWLYCTQLENKAKYSLIPRG